jgi:hypothetical protein
MRQAPKGRELIGKQVEKKNEAAQTKPNRSLSGANVRETTEEMVAV